MNPSQLVEAKRKLASLLCAKPKDDLTDAEVDILYALMLDPDIQVLLHNENAPTPGPIAPRPTLPRS